jgi:hypothetical protein
MPSAAAGVIRHGAGGKAYAGGGSKKGLQRRTTMDLKNYAYTKGRLAIDKLEQVLKDDTVSASVRVDAARELLDRAIGKPQASVAVTQELGGTFLEALRMVHEQSQAIENKDNNDTDTIDITPSAQSDS